MRASPAPPVNVLIVDDTSVMRDALDMFISHWPEFTVVGTACDGAEGVAQAQVLQPDVVLMDMRMPNMDGIEAARELRRLCPQIRVIMLSAYEDQALVGEACEAGAQAFLRKGSPPRELREAITVAMREVGYRDQRDTA